MTTPSLTATAVAPPLATVVPSTPSRLDNLKAQLGVVDDLLFAGIKNAAPATPTQQAKEPLSLQATSNNFRRFVQKSGPIFIAQDAAEALLKWEDAPTSLFFAAAWAFVCYYPYLLVVLPNVILITILLSTYHSRPSTTPALTQAAPAEGSIDYLANLQNIQIMMGRVSAGSDFAMVKVVPFLAWHDTRLSMFILHIALISGAGLLFVAPYLPWRLILLIGGETVFFAGHPIVLALGEQVAPYTTPLISRLSTRLNRLIEEDALPDSELDAQEIRLFEKLEIESFRDGVWMRESEIGGELDKSKGWSWSKALGGELWKVDFSYNGGDLDADGYVYLHLDGTLSSSPIALALVGVDEGMSTATTTAPTRRRRLVRRAVKATE